MVISLKRWGKKTLHYWKGLRTWLKLAFLLGLVLVIAGSGYVISSKTKNAEVAVRSTVKVERGAIRVTVSGSGPVLATREQVIKSPGSGTLQEMLVKDGQRVEEGQTILTLLSADVEARIAEVRDLERQVNDLYYRAPDAAVVTTVHVNPGQKVSAGTPILSLTDSKKVNLNVPAASSGDFQPGSRITMTLLEYGRQVTGKVLAVGNPYSINGKDLVSLSVYLDSGAVVQANTLVEAALEKGGQATPGSLNPGLTLEVKAPAEGIVKEILVNKNDMVESGEHLFTIESPALLSEYAAKLAALGNVKPTDRGIAVTANYTGYFYAPVDTAGPKNTYLQTGDEITAGQELGKVVSKEGVQISFTVDELDVGKVQIGQKATVTAGAQPGKTYEGEVVRIAGEGIVQNGVAFYWVTVEVKDWQGLMLGMTADVEIVVAEKEDVLVLPITAIQDMRGRKYVLLKEAPDRSKTNAPAAQGQRQLPENAVPVEIGLHNENMVEIVRGLEAGQEVLLPGAARTSNNSTGVPRMGVPVPGVVRPAGR
ncbi:MAG: HlyD family efflux transporter periplasmic adaptor subunit [Peptococcaceae bacterium]|jgi:HlyD family secretion protein|nr:HlyD family efflux transporter periplasmic adaptor subunit [Peptococcaceae bacterium]MDH7524875.1 HlyD family efflux transporter periplasmic adaptor subunit [Peptococcaceae bacterium]